MLVHHKSVSPSNVDQISSGCQVTCRPEENTYSIASRYSNTGCHLKTRVWGKIDLHKSVLICSMFLLHCLEIWDRIWFCLIFVTFNETHSQWSKITQLNVNSERQIWTVFNQGCQPKNANQSRYFLDFVYFSNLDVKIIIIPNRDMVSFFFFFFFAFSCFFNNTKIISQSEC